MNENTFELPEIGVFTMDGDIQAASSFVEIFDLTDWF